MPITSYDQTPVSTMISLPSGGQLTLTFNGNFFKISKSDRDFIYGLLDAMRAHEAVESEPEGKP
jgi:hypothetical protein